MNLFWLKYVSWALVGGAAFFYSAIRMNKLSLSSTTKALLCSICVVLACVAWHVQERNADLNSPRKLVIGTVTEVTAHTIGKSGSITDSFRLQLDSGSISQKFKTTDSVADSDALQPIHRGDQLGVLYRTWDDVPLSIDEIQGQQAGWRYHRYQGDLSAFIFTVAIVSIFFIPAALVASRRKEKQAGARDSTLGPND